MNPSRRLSTVFRPPPARKPEPFTQYVGDKIRGIPPTSSVEQESFKLGSGVKLGDNKLGV